MQHFTFSFSELGAKLCSLFECKSVPVTVQALGTLIHGCVNATGLNCNRIIMVRAMQSFSSRESKEILVMRMHKFASAHFKVGFLSLALISTPFSFAGEIQDGSRRDKLVLGAAAAGGAGAAYSTLKPLKEEERYSARKLEHAQEQVRLAQSVERDASRLKNMVYRDIAARDGLEYQWVMNRYQGEQAQFVLNESAFAKVARPKELSTLSFLGRLAAVLGASAVGTDAAIRLYNQERPVATRSSQRNSSIAQAAAKTAVFEDASAVQATEAGAAK